MRSFGAKHSVLSGRMAGVLLFALASCSTWPPHQRQGPPYFREHRAELIELRELFEQSDYVQLSTSSIRGPLVGRKTIEVGMTSANPASAERIVELLEQTLAIELYRDARGVQIHMGRKGIDGTFFSWWYHAGGEKIRACDDDERDRPCSMCQIDLEDGWNLRYRWHPDDMDVAEAVCGQDESWMSQLEKMREAQSQ